MLVLIGFIQAVISNRQSTITDAQTAIMERQVRISEIVERPWIAIDSTDLLSPVTFTNGGALLQIKMHLKNTGHVPASHTLLQAKFFVRYLSNYQTQMDPVWASGDQFRTMSLSMRGSGISIFPEQRQDMNYGAAMAVDDVKRLEVTPIVGVATFAGCIDYDGDGGVVRHQTRFVYEIDKKGPDGQVLLLSPAAGNVAIADVMVNLNPQLAGNPD
jgi:hypothetical protein